MASSRPPAAAAAEAALNSLSKIHISSTPPPSTTASERSDDVSTPGKRIFTLLLVAAAKQTSPRSPMLSQELSDVGLDQPCDYSEHAPSQHVLEEHDCNAPRGLNGLRKPWTVRIEVACASIAEGAYERWSSAVGHIEDAKVAVDIMARAIEDAVYLDEDAYNQMIPMQQYTRTIEEQQRQILTLEHQLQNALQSAAQQKAAGQSSRKRAAELQEELENNARVFKLHYDELLAKDAEIAKLKAVIQGLSSGK